MQKLNHVLGLVKAHRLTLYSDLRACAMRAGQKGKLFSLMHGIICTGNNNLIAGVPGLLHLILEIQHHLVHRIHLKARDWEP